MKTTWKVVFVISAVLLISGVAIFLQAYMLFAMLILFAVAGSVVTVFDIGRVKNPLDGEMVASATSRIGPSAVELQAAANVGMPTYRGINSYWLAAHPPIQK